jgi:hypothetical protein
MIGLVVGSDYNLVEIVTLILVIIILLLGIVPFFRR